MRNRQTFEQRMAQRDPKTQKGYEITLNSFEGFLGDHNYTVNQENCEDVVTEYINWFSQNHSPGTVWNYYSRIKKYLRHLKIIVDDIELPKIHEKELYPLKLDDIHRIFQKIKYHDQTMFGIQACSGLRIGETVGLRKRDFVRYGDRYIIKIPSQIAKFRRARTTVVSREMSQRLAVRLKKLEDDQLVFGTSPDIRYSEINKGTVLRRALDITGLNMKYDDTGRYQINTHSFRAFFITHVSRIDPNIAKKMAGEKGYLLQYDRLSDDELVENYERFEPDLTIFDLTKRDAVHNKKQNEMEEKFIEQDRTIKALTEKVDHLTGALYKQFIEKVNLRDRIQKK